MELLGIALSVPAAFIASLTYCLIIAKVVRRFDRVSRVLWWRSGGVLTWFVLEVLLLLTLGAVRARTMMDPAFYRAHLSVFFLGAPALANVLLLRRGGPSAGTSPCSSARCSPSCWYCFSTA